ncbi:MAG: TatD family hydrolase, partial [Bacteroidota bacterium]|nr:TatD family hydrolase [Bacteroidota bacterium]
MEWIDTHTHLYLPQFDEDRAEVMKRCETSGVNRLLLPNIDTDSLDQVDQMVKDYPGRAIPMMGLHPCSVGEDVEEQLSRIGEILFNDPQRFVAVGEIGIDLYWDKSTFEKQVSAFKRQIEWAKELNKPIVIHARDSFDEV